MAGGVTLLSFMTLFLPLSIVIPIHGVVQLVSNSSRSWFLKDHIDWQIFKYFAVGIPFGTVLSWLALKNIPFGNIPLIVIVALIFYTVFKPKRLPGLKISKKQFFFVGAVSGFLGLLIGATGPFIAPFFLRDDIEKESIVATKASVQLLVHAFKIPAFLALGFDYIAHIDLLILMSVGAVIGTKLGVTLLGKVNKKLFTTLYKGALILAALRIIYKIIASST